MPDDDAPMVYVLIEHGCAACEEPDEIVGVYRTRALAEETAARFPATHYASILARPLDPAYRVDTSRWRNPSGREPSAHS